MPGGRRQDPVDPDGGAAAEFALQLRELQGEAGLTLTQLAAAAQYSVPAVSKALKGREVPSWPLTSAIVKACGADPASWRERWETARTASRVAAQGQASTPAPPEAPRGKDPVPVRTSVVIAEPMTSETPPRLSSPSPPLSATPPPPEANGAPQPPRRARTLIGALVPPLFSPWQP